MGVFFPTRRGNLHHPPPHTHPIHTQIPRDPLPYLALEAAAAEGQGRGYLLSPTGGPSSPGCFAAFRARRKPFRARLQTDRQTEAERLMSLSHLT